MGELSFDNILGAGEIDGLFAEEESPAQEKAGAVDKEVPEKKGSPDVHEGENDETDETTEVNPDDLFEGDENDEPESVGSGKEGTEGEQEDASTDKGGDTSPENFYSSIASALAVDGIFPNLDEETIKKADSAEALSDLIESEVIARLDEKQQRIAKALENGVEPTDIRRYEGVLQQIARIKDSDIAEESETGEKLRSDLIYQDYINRGMAPEKARKLTQRSIEAGTDVEDAKEALQSNKEYFQNVYNKLLKDAEDNAKKEKDKMRKQAEQLKDSIMKDKQLLGDMELSNDVRKKVYETIAKPVYKDPETGEYLTALQRYEQEHHADFIKYVGLFMTLTNGFKDFEPLAKGKVQKEVKKGLRELYNKVNSTRRNADGSLRMVTSRRDDPESFLNGNFRLAL